MFRVLFITLSLFCFCTALAQTHPEYFQMSKIAKTQLDYRGAAKMMSKALELDPENVDYLVERGNIYLGLEKYDQALGDFNKAISIDSMNVDPWIGRSKYHLYIQKTDSALKDANVASILATSPYDEAKAGSALGQIYLHNGEDSLALKHFQESLALDTSNTEGYKKAALIFLRRKEFDDAERLLLRALKNDSKDLEILINLAYAYNQLEYFMQSIEYSNLALSLDGQHPLALSNRAYAYVNLNQNDKALEDINRSIMNDDRNPLAYRYKGEILLKIDPNDSKACKAFEKAKKLGYNELYDGKLNELTAEHCEKD